MELVLWALSRQELLRGDVSLAGRAAATEGKWVQITVLAVERGRLAVDNFGIKVLIMIFNMKRVMTIFLTVFTLYFVFTNSPILELKRETILQQLAFFVIITSIPSGLIFLYEKLIAIAEWFLLNIINGK
ncbi:hypothetical protein [Scandinavium sp.]|uniref:hypothetical protein n=1 Tax=Scandinavium sp. TaxID=2830653 RepID=UPI0028A0236C|nr:hypothetical protein [Scandinavium sp.]